MGFLKARENAGLTQTEVAEKMSVDQSAVSHWETGRTRPRAGQLVKLAVLYCCSVDDLLKEDDKK